MTVSDKQLQANRMNALKGGVKTAEGKAKVKHNAIKHGLLAKGLVIAVGGHSEAPEEFTRFLYGFQMELRPEGNIAGVLVKKIAVYCWKLRRAYRYEKGLIKNAGFDGLKVNKVSEDTDYKSTETKSEVENHQQGMAEFIELCLEDTSEMIAEVKCYLGITEKLTEEDSLQSLIDFCAEQIKPFEEEVNAGEEQKKQVLKYKRKLKIIKRLCNTSLRNKLKRILRHEGLIERQLHKVMKELKMLQTIGLSDDIPTSVEVDGGYE